MQRDLLQGAFAVDVLYFDGKLITHPEVAVYTKYEKPMLLPRH
jgi:hypothetical protein